MSLRFIILVSSVIWFCCSDAKYTWNDAGRVLGILIRNCWTHNARLYTKEHAETFLSCLQRRLLAVLERSAKLDVIPLMNGVELIRIQKSNYTDENRISRDNGKEKGIMPFSEWRSRIIDTLWRVFQTHAIKIGKDDEKFIESDARRRRRNQIMPLMVFGLVGLGMILIPMGFQFLAVLGGKALLLAKMALILCSIQGLKKVATSSINYGLYHAQPSNPWYDRRAEDTAPPYYLENYHHPAPYSGYH